MRKGAVTSGKSGGYLTVTFFTDKSAGSAAMLKALSDISVEPEISKCAYAKVEFKKDGKHETEFKVTAAPTILFTRAPARPGHHGHQSSPAGRRALGGARTAGGGGGPGPVYPAGSSSPWGSRYPTEVT